MYINRCFVFCFVFRFVCGIPRESEKCNLMELCSNSDRLSGDRNLVIEPIDQIVPSYLIFCIHFYLLQLARRSVKNLGVLLCFNCLFESVC